MPVTLFAGFNGIENKDDSKLVNWNIYKVLDNEYFWNRNRVKIK